MRRASVIALCALLVGCAAPHPMGKDLRADRPMVVCADRVAYQCSRITGRALF